MNVRFPFSAISTPRWAARSTGPTGWPGTMRGFRRTWPIGPIRWLLTWRAAPAGYFELRAPGDGAVEIAYFGLLPDYFGRRWGGHLLTRAVETAWSLGASRVWLRTCTLDHPAALPNYLRRGFQPVREETYTAHLPED